MGTLPPPSIMIKTLLASTLLALTAAEADPQLLYGAGLPYAAGVPYVGATVGAVAHAPVVKSDVLTPAEVEHEVTAHTVPVAVGITDSEALVTTARDLLTPSQRLMPTTVITVTEATDTEDTGVTMARGLLMLSPPSLLEAAE